MSAALAHLPSINAPGGPYAVLRMEDEDSELYRSNSHTKRELERACRCARACTAVRRRPGRTAIALALLLQTLALAGIGAYLGVKSAEKLPEPSQIVRELRVADGAGCPIAVGQPVSFTDDGAARRGAGTSLYRTASQIFFSEDVAVHTVAALDASTLVAAFQIAGSASGNFVMVGSSVDPGDKAIAWEWTGMQSLGPTSPDAIIALGNTTFAVMGGGFATLGWLKPSAAYGTTWQIFLAPPVEYNLASGGSTTANASLPLAPSAATSSAIAPEADAPAAAVPTPTPGPAAPIAAAPDRASAALLSADAMALSFVAGEGSNASLYTRVGFFIPGHADPDQVDLPVGASPSSASASTEPPVGVFSWPAIAWGPATSYAGVHTSHAIAGLSAGSYLLCFPADDGVTASAGAALVAVAASLVRPSPSPAAAPAASGALSLAEAASAARAAAVAAASSTSIVLGTSAVLDGVKAHYYFSAAAASPTRAVVAFVDASLNDGIRAVVVNVLPGLAVSFGSTLVLNSGHGGGVTASGAWLQLSLVPLAAPLLEFDGLPAFVPAQATTSARRLSHGAAGDASLVSDSGSDSSSVDIWQGASQLSALSGADAAKQALPHAAGSVADAAERSRGRGRGRGRRLQHAADAADAAPRLAGRIAASPAARSAAGAAAGAAVDAMTSKQRARSLQAFPAGSEDDDDGDLYFDDDDGFFDDDTSHVVAATQSVGRPFALAFSDLSDSGRVTVVFAEVTPSGGLLVTSPAFVVTGPPSGAAAASSATGGGSGGGGSGGGGGGGSGGGVGVTPSAWVSATALSGNQLIILDTSTVASASAASAASAAASGLGSADQRLRHRGLKIRSSGSDSKSGDDRSRHHDAKSRQRRRRHRAQQPVCLPGGRWDLPTSAAVAADLSSTSSSSSSLHVCVASTRTAGMTAAAKAGQLLSTLGATARVGASSDTSSGYGGGTPWPYYAVAVANVTLLERLNRPVGVALTDAECGGAVTVLMQGTFRFSNGVPQSPDGQAATRRHHMNNGTVVMAGAGGAPSSTGGSGGGGGSASGGSAAALLAPNPIPACNGGSLSSVVGGSAALAGGSTAGGSGSGGSGGGSQADPSSTSGGSSAASASAADATITKAAAAVAAAAAAAANALRQSAAYPTGPNGQYGGSPDAPECDTSGPYAPGKAYYSDTRGRLVEGPYSGTGGDNLRTTAGAGGFLTTISSRAALDGDASASFDTYMGVATSTWELLVKIP